MSLFGFTVGIPTLSREIGDIPGRLSARSRSGGCGLTRSDGLFVGFQRVEGYRAPSWPDQTVPQQLHLDFAVEDLDEAEARLLELGAGKPDYQPGRDRWRVFTDPAGHPFCLVRR